MMLRFDPFEVFKASRTPAGLYARQKWLGESEESAWQSDFKSTVDAIRARQTSDGSWGHSTARTIHELFGLHLTVRNQSDEITKALRWLRVRTEDQFPQRRLPLGESLVLPDDMPFSKGCLGFLLCSATLFLHTIFGLGEEESVIRMYDYLSDMGVQKKGRWCGWLCSNNILRAFVVHPEYNHGQAVKAAVKGLSELQNEQGRWSGRVPFYQTVNALAHLDLPEADQQLTPAFERLLRTQNRDGTWGRYNREWNSFLVIHALKNKGIL